MSKQTLKPLKLHQQIAYALGQLGWSGLHNIVYTLLVYFYLPPKTANLPELITERKFLGFIGVLVIVAALGRVLEAITDPLIAGMSDRSRSKSGRRIPFMKFSFIPAALFCTLMFVPPDTSATTRNLIWLIAMQFLFYPFYTMYVIPHSTLLLEVAHSEKMRVRLATFGSVGHAVGGAIVATIPIIANTLQEHLGFSRIHSIQTGIAICSVICAIGLLIPTLFIKESEHSSSFIEQENVQRHPPVRESLRQTFKNPQFVAFVFPDCFYWTGLNLITTGILYYVTVLMEMDEKMLTPLMGILMGASLIFYPIINILSNRMSRKKLIQFSFISFAFVFGIIALAGLLPLPKMAQAVIIMVSAALPFSFLSVLPNTVLADIAEHDALYSNERKEGMYFGVRTMIMKAGQTLGIIIFTLLLSFGKERGHDLGLRLTGVAGLLLCIIAAWMFRKYNEEKVLSEISQKKKEVVA